MWKCGVCTLENEQASVACIACETPRPMQQTASSTWSCETCTLENGLAAMSCAACGTARPQSGGGGQTSGGVPPPPPSSGAPASSTQGSAAPSSSSSNMWQCSLCTLENEILSTSCVACGTPRAGLDQRFHAPSQTSTMSSTSAPSASSASSQPQRQTPQPPAQHRRSNEQARVTEPAAPRVWTCGMCRMENGISGTVCLACGTPRPGFEPKVEPPPAAAPRSNEEVPSQAASDLVKPLESLKISETGRAVLSAGEVELKVERGLYFYKRDKRWMEDGTATATSHRLLWSWEERGKPPVRLSLPLKEVEGVTDKAAFMKTSKLCILLRGEGGEQGMFFQLGFPKGAKEEFGRALRKALAAKEWERDADRSRPAGLVEEAQYRPAVHTGIGSLLEMQVQRNEATGAMLGSALTDLDGLMAHAKEMVAIAEKMRSTLVEQQGGKGGGDSDEFGPAPGDEDDDDLSNVLLQAGIVNPVSKGVVGTSHFHEELAAQLLDFLQPMVRASEARRAGGMLDGTSTIGGRGQTMMTLTDLFCVYNRARGIDMVSPADLRKACELFAVKGYPLRLERFASGVLVVQAAEGEAPSMEAILASYPAGIAAPDLAQVLGLSVALARDKLKAAEATGEICRDDSIEGLRFFPNKFKLGL